ncbi:MAG: alkaline phosphatase family protein [Acetanaerobacterium sp.]
MPNKLFVLSIDALQTGDLEFLKTQPNFSEIFKKAAVVKNVREVYPTLTNVNHTSMITGVTADKHGIYHNMIPYLPTKHVDWNIVGQNWFWNCNAIKVPTLVDAAKEKGYVTACVTWPCMGGNVPDYNLAEMWPNTKDTLLETYEASCTPNVMELYFEKYVAPFNFKSSFDTDGFSVPIAVDITKRFKPDLMLEHIICLDYRRHKSGNNHPMVEDVLRRVDGLVGVIMDGYKEAGIYDDTNFVFLGDHGQMNIAESFNLNVALKNHSLVTMDEDGHVLDYEAYCFSAGFSAHIILKDPSDSQLKEKVYGVLKEIQKENPQYIERIYTEQEAALEEGLSGAFSFVVEAQSGICFENVFDGPISMSSKDPAYHSYASNHGYHPSKGPKPTFIAFGPDIREGVVIDGADILDECPTFAKLLGVEMSGMMGKPLDILK